MTRLEVDIQAVLVTVTLQAVEVGAKTPGWKCLCHGGLERRWQKARRRWGERVALLRWEEGGSQAVGGGGVHLEQDPLEQDETSGEGILAHGHPVAQSGHTWKTTPHRIFLSAGLYTEHGHTHVPA